MSEAPNSNYFFSDVYPEATAKYLAGCHQLVKSLFNSILSRDRPRREWFSNDVNYLYYMFYVHPKVLARDYEASIYGEKRGKSYSKSLVISKSYIGIYVKVKVESDYCYGNEYEYMYVVGVDNLSNKLFVNKVPRMPSEYADAVYYGKFYVAFTDDKAFWQIFGYNYDVDDSRQCVTIDSIGNYRVQGEIVITCEKTNDLFMRLINNFDSSIEDYLQALALDRMYGILMEIGYNPEITSIGRNVELNIDIKLNDKQFSNFVNNVTRAIKKYFDGVNNEIDYCYAKIFARTGDLGEITFHIVRRKNLDRINICVDYVGRETMHKSQLYNKVISELKSAFENTHRGDFEFWLGEHRIRVKNAYSLRMTYVPEIQPIFINELNISSNENAFAVYPDSVVQISHGEHGNKCIKFNDAFVVRFLTTSVDRRFTEERNKVVNYILSNSKI